MGHVAWSKRQSELPSEVSYRQIVVNGGLEFIDMQACPESASPSEKRRAPAIAGALDIRFLEELAWLRAGSVSIGSHCNLRSFATGSLYWWPSGTWPLTRNSGRR